MSATVLYWRRTDEEGLERLEIAVEPDGVAVRGTVLCLEAGGLQLDHHWSLDAAWRTRWAFVERRDARGREGLRLERAGRGWTVDGVARPDLDGADEPDLSVTPFCNTLPIRRLAAAPGAALELDVALVDGATLTVTRSRQRYARKGPGLVRFTALGPTSPGFEADLAVDADGLVLRYEYLFERIARTDA
ncbi:putative glycolipid-binding domain-containing protein [Salinarimonas rosea]|uniref:putative glycolipid-binding domain-containing protein n=1 Tax=Salinarimonas rosea TaxID=552063 RepID=UPI00040F692D|nr:putative glycolipid-binding domain-containing protein [Salinarimonas rosea]